jgi:hypothetical protein
VSTVTTSGNGVFTQTTTTPNPGGSAGVRYGAGSLQGSYTGGFTVTTFTCIGGRCSPPTTTHH